MASSLWIHEVQIRSNIWFRKLHARQLIYLQSFGIHIFFSTQVGFFINKNTMRWLIIRLINAGIANATTFLCSIVTPIIGKKMSLNILESHLIATMWFLNSLHASFDVPTKGKLTPMQCFHNSMATSIWLLKLLVASSEVARPSKIVATRCR